MNRFFAVWLLALILFSHSVHAENADRTLTATELAEAGLNTISVDEAGQSETDGNHGSSPENDIAAALLEIAFWQSVEYSIDSADLEVYLKQYPNGVYVELARLKLSNPDNFKDEFEFHGIDMEEMSEIYEDPIWNNMLTVWLSMAFGAVLVLVIVLILVFCPNPSCLWRRFKPEVRHSDSSR